MTGNQWPDGPTPAPSRGRRLWVRDDLDGYGAMITWDVADGIPALASVTIVHNGRPTIPVPPMPARGAPGAEWLAWGRAREAAREAGHYRPLSADDVDVLILTLWPGMTADDVRTILAGIDDAHAPGIVRALDAMRRVARDQWQRDLLEDVVVSTRPTASLARDRATMPVPDPEVVRADKIAIWADINIIDDLRLAVAQAVEATDVTPPSPSRPIPDDLPTQTGIGLHTLGTALADGPSGYHWGHDATTGAIQHARPGAGGRVTVGDDPGSPAVDPGSAAVAAWLSPASEATIRRAGLRGYGCLQVVTGMLREALTREGITTVQVELDHLARVVGLTNHGSTHDERMAARRQVHDILRTIAAIHIETGEPRVAIRERGKIVTYAWHARVWAIEAVLVPPASPSGQMPLVGLDTVPHAIRVRASDQLARLARIGNRALPVLGKGNRLDAIPAGQPSGSWARAIGYATIYHARVRATHTLTLPRRDLLCTYPGDPHPENAVRRNGRRAVTYWNGARQILATLAGGPLWRAIDDPPPPAGRGWAEKWMRQSVVLTLNPEAPEMAGLDAVVAGRAAQAAQATTRRRPRARTP
jgi:hypothetical protein